MLTQHIDVVFDQISVEGAPPEYSFIEVENDQQYSISLGEWVKRADGYWVIRFKKSDVIPFFGEIQ